MTKLLIALTVIAAVALDLLVNFTVRAVYEKCEQRRRAKKDEQFKM